MMWIRTYEKVYKGIKREKVWQLWKDVNNWHLWHGDLDYCRMEGPFEVGNHFFLKPKGVAEVRIEITELEAGVQFTDCTKFFGAKMYDTHSIIETKEGVMLKNKLVVTGPLQWFWIKLVAQNVANSVPEDMEELVKLARASS